MTISSKSPHVKLYRFIYGTQAKLPTSLCVYFWPLVFAVLVVLPLTAFCSLLLAVLSTGIFFGSIGCDRAMDDVKEQGLLKAGLYYSVMGYLSLFGLVMILFGMASIMFPQLPGRVYNFNGLSDKGIKRDISNLHAVGYVGYSIVAIVLGNIIYSIIRKKPSTNILIAFLKAKFHKYCPKINWVD